MQRVALAVGFAGLLFLAPSPARAAIVRVDFSGVVTSVAKDGGGMPIPRWSFVVESATPFSGFYIYDDSQTDGDPDPRHGFFAQAGSPFSYRVAVGPYLFATDEFFVQVWDDVAVPVIGVDGQAVRGDDVVGTGDPMAPVATRLVVAFGSDDENTIDDDVLVPDDELLDLFQRALLLISICPELEPDCDEPLIELVGTVQTLTVPEPGDGAASAAVIAALSLAGAWRRRGAPSVRSS